ncbi:MAG: hypothetical protein IT289_10625 [Oligoflexia bacterium]|nr:hypothetical protein [Oligoflexia bacterium]
MIPQAFTTRDVSEAYKWVQSVSPSVRESIKTVDQLVALYLKVKRFGGAALDEFMLQQDGASRPEVPTPPVQSKSAEDFQKTLKGLKAELEQFDFSPTPHQATAPQVASAESTAATAPTEPTNPAPPQAPRTAPHPMSDHLDPRSRQIISEIKEHLNLSSDQEVVRMLIVLGAQRLKSLLTP